jgi:hypothetical protein
MSGPSAPPQAVRADEILGLIGLEPQELATQARALAERQAEADARATARVVLDLVDALAEHDSSAVSHLLRAVLRLALGAPLLAVEKTALRIAGLASLREEKLQPTPEGEALLAILSGAGPAHNPAPAAQETPAEAAPAAPGTPEAFATMRFGEITFEIAESGEGEGLIFRTSEQEAWLPLVADRTSGWVEIGAEMLNRVTDTTGTYVKTHTIRLPDPDHGPDVHRFELDHLHWWMQDHADGARFSTDPQAGWQAIDSRLQGDSLRDLGIAAAERMLPEFRAQIAADVQSWVRRMAHAAAIMPVLPRVA